MYLANLKGRALTAGITITSGVSFMLFGWDQGVFGGILGNQEFLSTFNYPSATIQGQIVSTYDIGCILGAFLSFFVGDRYGRRKAIALACLSVVIGGALQASSFSLAQMIIGRVIAGVGIGLNSATIPMWQSETSKPEHRGKLIALQLVLVIFGIDLTQWVNLGMTYIPGNDVSWRFPVAFQCFLALLAMLLLWFMPESPRWLCYRGRQEEAQEIWARLQNTTRDDPKVHAEINLILDTINHEQEARPITWREVFAGGEQQDLRRILLGAGTSLMQQLGGINVVVYYLPVIFTQSFGFSPRLALILSAVDFLSLCFWGLMISFVIDRVGRKNLMLYGALGQSFCFAMAAIGLGIGTMTMNGVAVAFIFMYHVCFGLSFLSIPFMYPSEINSQRMRNTGNAVAMMTNWVGVYIIVSITPPAITNIGWRFYIIFAVLNFAWVPFIWYFYVETAGLSLEEVDLMFAIKYNGGKDMTYKEARRLTLGQRQTSTLTLSEKTIDISQDEFKA
ncbi:Nn.00g054800.m01.CDS01 [Neocucurbitaria sp. VM-36]